MAAKQPKVGAKPNQYVVKRGAVPPAVYLLHVSDKQWEEFIEAACRLREINGAKYCVGLIAANRSTSVGTLGGRL